MTENVNKPFGKVTRTERDITVLAFSPERDINVKMSIGTNIS